MNEQQWAAVAEFKIVKARVVARRPERKRKGPRCHGPGFTVMVTPKGPVTVPCGCCGGGSE